MNLEICVDSPSCAHLSLQSSANSVELCASLSVGGLTPSISAVASLANIHDKYPQSHVTILVRPREGNFIYTPAEKDLIISDVKTYKDLLSPHGLHSFTVGCLTSDSKLDADFLKTVNDLGVEITLHRCVDDILSLQTMSPSEIVETAAKSGVVRILTSGGKKTAVEGLMNIKKMVAYAREHYPLLTIIAGSGVTAENVNMFKEIGVECVHVGSGVKVNEEIEEHARSPLFGGERKVVDVEKVRNIINVINGEAAVPEPTTTTTNTSSYTEMDHDNIKSTVTSVLQTSNASLKSKNSGLKLTLTEKEDVPDIMEQIVGLAVYEKEPDALNISREVLEVDGFGKNRRFYCLLLQEESTGKSFGFAFFYFAYSTWEGRVLYLEDLYIDESKRGRGAGAVTMMTLASIAKQLECKRFVWQALDWNTPAIEFYERIGAEVLKEWVSLRMDEKAIEKFLVD